MIEPAELRAFVWGEIGEVNTSTPGIIVDYSLTNDGLFATVKTTASRRMADGTIVQPPEIHRVPVMWPSTDNGRAFLTMPIKPGDCCFLIFAQRSIDEWIEGVSDVPTDPRQYDLTDAFCLPFPNPTRGVGDIDLDRVRLQYGDGFFALDSGGNLEARFTSAKFHGGPIEFGDDAPVTMNASLTANEAATFNSGIDETTGHVVSNGIGLTTHKHLGVRSGESSTMSPVP